MPAMGRGGQELIGSSEPMEDLRAYIPKVALCDASVLIQGETGTGKELMARTIHLRSGRADGRGH